MWQLIKWTGRWLRRAVIATVVVALAVAVVSIITRDRIEAVQLLVYLPVGLFGLFAVVLDLCLRGRALFGRPQAGFPKRFMLTTIGAAAMLWHGFTMVGWQSTVDVDDVANAQTARVLHWNVRSGAGTDRAWDSLVNDVVAQSPDVVVLSEAPWGNRIERLRVALGEDWQVVAFSRVPGGTYWVSHVVISRWPMTVTRPAFDVPNGSATPVSIKRGKSAINMLVVDGLSHPHRPRTPMLNRIAEIVDDQAGSGPPYDMIVGDFNAVSRSVGFDAITQAACGYDFAAAHSGQWRGTWPSDAPLFDIDHILVRKDWPIVDCDLFTSPSTDHRGQVVEVLMK